MSGRITRRVRCRVGGLLIDQNSVLLVFLNLPTREDPVWMPPGGEVEFGETMELALKREFREETAVKVEVDSLGYVNEFVESPYHAVEHYFRCHRVGGSVKKGGDPEYDSEDQLIQDVAFHPLDQLHELRLEPAFLKDHLNKDWQQHQLTKTRWVATSD